MHAKLAKYAKKGGSLGSSGEIRALHAEFAGRPFGRTVEFAEYAKDLRAWVYYGEIRAFFTTAQPV